MNAGYYVPHTTRAALRRAPWHGSAYATSRYAMTTAISRGLTGLKLQHAESRLQGGRGFYMAIDRETLPTRHRLIRSRGYVERKRRFQLHCNLWAVALVRFAELAAEALVIPLTGVRRQRINSCIEAARMGGFLILCEVRFSAECPDPRRRWETMPRPWSLGRLPTERRVPPSMPQYSLPLRPSWLPTPGRTRYLSAAKVHGS